MDFLMCCGDVLHGKGGKIQQAARSGPPFGNAQELSHLVRDRLND